MWAKAEKMKRCARCHETCYCGVECQKAHWKAGHKAVCQLLPEPDSDIAVVDLNTVCAYSEAYVGTLNVSVSVECPIVCSMYAS